MTSAKRPTRRRKASRKAVSPESRLEDLGITCSTYMGLRYIGARKVGDLLRLDDDRLDQLKLAPPYMRVTDDLDALLERSGLVRTSRQRI